MLSKDTIQVTDTEQGILVGKLKEPEPMSYMENSEIVMFADGLDNMLTYIAKKMPRALQYGSSTRSGNNKFNSFPSYEFAMDTFRNHPEDITKFNPAELRIKDDNESGSRVDFEVVGDYIDMGRYMEGIPESWGSMHNGNARNRRVRIIMSLVQRADMQFNDIQHRGERILRLIDALEAGGVRTELTGIESSECSHIELILKRPDEPLTITDLAVVVHPEFLRRIIFRVIEHSDTFEYSYGNAESFHWEISSKPELLNSGNNDEITVFIAGNIRLRFQIDAIFDKLERLLVWELSKPVPEVDAISINQRGVHFVPNGMRASEEIKREGMEIINAEV